MDKLLNDILNYMCFLKNTLKLNISLDWNGFPKYYTEYVSDYIQHDLAYCRRIKNHAWSSCILCKKIAIRKSPDHPFIGTCYAGVSEIVYPLSCNGKIINILSISGYLPRSYAFNEKLTRRAKINKEEFENLRKELNPHIPSIEKLNPIIRPLVWMLESFFERESQKIHPGDDEQQTVFNQLFVYLSENYHKKISVKELSDYVHYSSSYIIKLFKEKKGITITEYLVSLRINKAKQLLEYTSKSIREISSELGYKSPYYFSNQFKQLTGKSPRLYRKTPIEHKNEPPLS